MVPTERSNDGYFFSFCLADWRGLTDSASDERSGRRLGVVLRGATAPRSQPIQYEGEGQQSAENAGAVERAQFAEAGGRLPPVHQGAGRRPAARRGRRDAVRSVAKYPFGRTAHVAGGETPARSVGGGRPAAGSTGRL